MQHVFSTTGELLARQSTLEWGYIVLNMGCGDFTLDYLFLSLSPHIQKNHHDAISVVVVAYPKYLAQLVAMIQPMVMLPHTWYAQG